MKKRLLIALLAAVALSLPFGVTRAKATDVFGLLATIDPVTLFAPDDPVITDPANDDPVTNDPPHFPKGGKFKLFGTAKDDVDPENPYNQVISFDTTCGPGGTAPSCDYPNAIAGAYKKFGDHVKVDRLDDMVELKYYFVGRTCAGDGPRIQLGISGDGDGRFNQFSGGPDQNAFGHLGNVPFGGGCAMDMWVYEDMTNSVAKWDLSQWNASGFPAACNMTCTWSQMETYFNTFWPNHRVLNEVLVDDAASFAPLSRGCAYFDLVSGGARTIHNWDDTGDGHPNLNNC